MIKASRQIRTLGCWGGSRRIVCPWRTGTTIVAIVTYSAIAIVAMNSVPVARGGALGDDLFLRVCSDTHRNQESCRVVQKRIMCTLPNALNV